MVPLECLVIWCRNKLLIHTNKTRLKGRTKVRISNEPDVEKTNMSQKVIIDQTTPGTNKQVNVHSRKVYHKLIYHKDQA